MRLRRFFPPIHEEVNKGHGRLEIRRIAVANVSEIPTINFPGARQIFWIERKVWRKNKLEPSIEIAHCITSLSSERASAKQLLALNRGHWAIENKSHYVRDVTFGEDLSRNRSGAGPSVIASLRNFAISVIRLTGSLSIAESLRTFGRNPSQAIRAIGLVVESKTTSQ